MMPSATNWGGVAETTATTTLEASGYKPLPTLSHHPRVRKPKAKRPGKTFGRSKGARK